MANFEIFPEFAWEQRDVERTHNAPNEKKDWGVLCRCFSLATSVFVSIHACACDTPNFAKEDSFMSKLWGKFFWVFAEKDEKRQGAVNPSSAFYLLFRISCRPPAKIHNIYSAEGAQQEKILKNSVLKIVNLLHAWSSVPNAQKYRRYPAQWKQVRFLQTKPPDSLPFWQDVSDHRRVFSWRIWNFIQVLIDMFKYWFQIDSLVSLETMTQMCAKEKKSPPPKIITLSHLVIVAFFLESLPGKWCSECSLFCWPKHCLNRRSWFNARFCASSVFILLWSLWLLTLGDFNAAYCRL